MKLKKNLLKMSILLFLLIMGISTIYAHGVDVTNDKMIIANETNGQQIKDIADANGINISVYKFTSEDEVAHQLEHMLNNSNKYIIVVAYQDTANDFLKEHQDMSSRLIVLEDFDDQTIKEEMLKITSQENSSDDSFKTNLLYGSVVVIVILLIVGGILFTRDKKK